MKKILAAIAMLFLVAGIGRADYRPGPHSGHADPTFVEYGGVSVDTMSFSGVHRVVTTKRCVFHGVIFSSGSTLDFVAVYDTGSLSSPLITTDDGRNTRSATLYNVNESSVGVGQSGSAAGFSGPPYPMLMRHGLILKPNTSAYNTITVLYHQLETGAAR